MSFNKSARAKWIAAATGLSMSLYASAATNRRANRAGFTMWFCLIVAFVLVPTAARAVTFADGLVHTIDGTYSFPVEAVVVQDGPGGASTTISLLPGGEIGTVTFDDLSLYGVSRLAMSGGCIGNTLYANDDSVADISDADVSGCTVWKIVANGRSSVTYSDGTSYSARANDNSELTIAGATITSGGTGVSGASTAYLTSGTIESLWATDTAVATITGGTFGYTAAYQGSRVHIRGGAGGEVYASGVGYVEIAGGQVVTTIQSAENSIIDILSGALSATVNSRDASRINVFGGTISGPLQAVDGSTITIVGGSFNYPLGPLSPLTGTIGGTLIDGTPINVSFVRASTAQILLSNGFDSDGDGVLDGIDNCVGVPNGNQTDTDASRVGDACNDAQDPDGDEYETLYDNCPDNVNPLQEDSDADHLGDLCDPFPDNPDNRQAQCDADLAVCGADLTTCLSGVAPDNDGDGEPDLADRCPDTLSNEPVDDSGCSQDEFCAKVDVTVRENRRTCRKLDWLNDEPTTGSPRDCAISAGTVSRASDDTCVPYID